VISSNKTNEKLPKTQFQETPKKISIIIK